MYTVWASRRFDRIVAISRWNASSDITRARSWRRRSCWTGSIPYIARFSGRWTYSPSRRSVNMAMIESRSTLVSGSIGGAAASASSRLRPRSCSFTAAPRPARTARRGGRAGDRGSRRPRTARNQVVSWTSDGNGGASNTVPAGGGPATLFGPPGMSDSRISRPTLAVVTSASSASNASPCSIAVTGSTCTLRSSRITAVHVHGAVGSSGCRTRHITRRLADPHGRRELLAGRPHQCRACRTGPGRR